MYWGIGHILTSIQKFKFNNINLRCTSYLKSSFYPLEGISNVIFVAHVILILFQNSILLLCPDGERKAEGQQQSER